MYKASAGSFKKYDDSHGYFKWTLYDFKLLLIKRICCRIQQSTFNLKFIK